MTLAWTELRLQLLLKTQNSTLNTSFTNSKSGKFASCRKPRMWLWIHFIYIYIPFLFRNIETTWTQFLRKRKNELTINLKITLYKRVSNITWRRTFDRDVCNGIFAYIHSRNVGCISIKGQWNLLGRNINGLLIEGFRVKRCSIRFQIFTAVYPCVSKTAVWKMMCFAVTTNILQLGCRHRFRMYKMRWEHTQLISGVRYG